MGCVHRFSHHFVVHQEGFEMSVRCKALTQKGKPCRALAMTHDYKFMGARYVRVPVEYEYCYNHVWIHFFLIRDIAAFEAATGQKVTIS
jgi:hypothetical protein